MDDNNRRVIFRAVATRVFVFLILICTFTSFLIKSISLAAGITRPLSFNPDEKDIQTLERGVPVERHLAGGETHRYQIHLDTGQFLHLVVEQKGIDVVVTAFDPDSQKIAEVDYEKGDKGQELLMLISKVIGMYQVKVSSFEKKSPSGNFIIRIEELRVATNKDSMRIAAKKNFEAAKQLQNYQNADSARKAIKNLEEALLYWKSLGDSINNAYTLDYLGKFYSDLGEKQKALENLKKALSIFQSSGLRENESSTLNDIGAIYWALSDYQIAIEYYDKSLSIQKMLADSAGLAETLNNIGAVYRSLGENRIAMSKYKDALKISRDIKDSYKEGVFLFNIADLYAEWGENQEALNYFKQAHHIFESLQNSLGQCHTLRGIGSAYHSTGEYKIALDYYERALQLARTIGDRFSEAYISGNIGHIFESLKDYQKALEYFDQSLSITQALSDRSGEAHVLNSIGKIYRWQGEYQKALEYCQEALSIAHDIGNKYVQIGIHMNIGWVYSQLGELQQSLDYFNKGLSLARSTDDLESQARMLRGMAWAEREQENFSQARNHINHAIQIVDSLRSKIASKEHRASFMVEYYQYYAFYVNLLMQLHQKQPHVGHDIAALQCTERVRARSLLELLAELKSVIRSGIDPDLLVREKNLLNQIDVKEQSLGQLRKKKNNKEKIRIVEKEMRALLEEYNQIQTQIRYTSPKYAALIQPQHLSVKEIQQLILDDETILLEYAFGDINSFAWVVTKDSMFSYQLPKQNEIETIAKRVYSLLTFRNQQLKGEIKNKRQSIVKADSDLNDNMSQLSQMILSPLIDDLKAKRLLVVGDGALQYIPFGSLPIPGQDADAKPPISLISNFEIICLPSASIVPILRQGTEKTKPNKLVAVLADPVFSEDDPRVKNSRLAARVELLAASDAKNAEYQEHQFLRSIQESGLGANRSEISRLPFSRLEANSITALVPPEKYSCALDFDANYAAATSSELSEYRIVHFATHGLLNSSHPELSGIVLSLVDNQGEPQKGFLRLIDIYNMNLSADLVVLSACQTALGKDIRGEGLVGLTRGFMYAGAPRVVASLWKVDDEATAELMKRFYQFMLGEEQLPAAAALRQAQLSIMNEKRWQSPYYWAGFVLQGDWQ